MFVEADNAPRSDGVTVGPGKGTGGSRDGRPLCPPHPTSYLQVSVPVKQPPAQCDCAIRLRRHDVGDT